jgi:Aldehyde dehydrogenase family
MPDSSPLHDLLAGHPKNWGRWDDDDEVGGLNILAEPGVLRSVAAVRTGRVFTLGSRLARRDCDPVWPGHPTGAAVWSANAERAHRAAHRIRAGTVWINCYDAGDVSIPFGGYKQSGHGREKGEYALELYTEVKAVVANLED